MKVVLVMVMTADGCIAKSESQSSLDWTTKEDMQFFVRKTKECGAVIVGNTTYKTIGKPLPGRLMKIMTRDTLRAKESVAGEAEFTAASPQEVLSELEERGYDQVALIGGSTINGLFLEAGLVDELFLSIAPHLFGNGVRLAKANLNVSLELVGTEQLSNQVINMHYRVMHQ